MSDQATPTPEDLHRATEVSQAAAQAAVEAHSQGGGEAEVRDAVDRGIESRAREVQLTLSDQERNSLADLVIEKLRDAGAFDPPPATPTPETATPTPEAAAEQAAAAEANQPEPRKRTFAERYAGL